MSMVSKLIQKKSDARMEAVQQYYFRLRERLSAERTKAITALIDEIKQQVTGVSNGQQQRENERSKVVDLTKRTEISRSSIEKQTTNNDKLPVILIYSFRARNSLFPDPKHCNFLHHSAAKTFCLPKSTSAGSAAKASARSALLTTMAMMATDPQSQAKKLDSVFTQASTPGRSPNYGKISSTGLYIKYNPGSNKSNAQRLTGNFTMAGKTGRQELIFWKRTEQYSTESFLIRTAYSTALFGETFRQEFYYGFRKPPPYRDKTSGTEFNSTVQTKGATLRREHYEAFRRPPPTRDRLHSARNYLSTKCTYDIPV